MPSFKYSTQKNQVGLPATVDNSFETETTRFARKKWFSSSSAAASPDAGTLKIRNGVLTEQRK
ncbi:MAG: hypothetical protein IJO40_03415 [Thermoguttaceae bacterium]|nr:hypothetical protein [Thermoguttaceae bacterium]